MALVSNDKQGSHSPKGVITGLLRYHLRGSPIPLERNIPQWEMKVIEDRDLGPVPYQI